METIGSTALPSTEQQGRNWEKKCIRFSFRKYLAAVMDATASLILFAIFLPIAGVHYVRQCSRALLRWDHAWMTGKPFLVSPCHPLSLSSRAMVTAKSYERPASSLKLIILAILMWFLFVACFNMVSVGKIFHFPAQLYVGSEIFLIMQRCISWQYSPPTDQLFSSSVAGEGLRWPQRALGFLKTHSKKSS